MTKPSSGRAIIAIAVLLAGADCSGSSSLTPGYVPLTSPLAGGPRGWPNPMKGAKPILFVADLVGNAVHLYDPNTPNPSLEGSITDGVSGPQGLAVDSKGSLYVSNVSSAGGTITVYSAGQSKPRLTIPGPAITGSGSIRRATFSHRRSAAR
jgi:hypothetical protein